MISALSINGILQDNVLVIKFTERTLSGKTDVIEYDGTSLEQEPIPPDVFYTRRSLDLYEGGMSVRIGLFIRYLLSLTFVF